MKHFKLLLALVVSMFTLNISAQDASAVGEGQFFLYNVGNGAYLTGANNWGTRASVDAHGLYCTLTGSDNTFYINTGSAVYLGDDGYVDKATNDANYTAWVFTPVKGLENTYTINTVKSGKYLVYDGSGSTCSMVEATPTDANGYWKLYTRDALLNALDLTAATETNPIDVTFLMGSSNFVRVSDGFLNNPGAVTNSSVGAWSVTTSGNNAVVSGPSSSSQLNTGCEFWNNTFDINQTITVPNGKYIVAFDGFGSTNTRIYGNEVETAFTKTGAVNSHNFANALLNIGDYSDNRSDVINVSGGSLKFGVKRSTNAGAEWTVIDNARLYFLGQVDLTDLINGYHNALQKAQDLQSERMSAESLAGLQSAATTYASVDETNEEALTTATSALNDAIAAANASIANYQGVAAYLAKMGGVLDLTNVYTAESYATYFSDIESRYNNGTLTDADAQYTANSAWNSGWKSANFIDDILLSAWTIGGNAPSYETGLYINTWSTEGNTDGSGMTTPFFEYFGGEGGSIGTTTIQATVPGLDNTSNYMVSALVRVRATNSNDAPTVDGVTFQVGDGNAVNASDGRKSTSEPRMYYKTVVAYGKPDASGNLTITFNVNANNMIHWLSFKNVKYEVVEVTQDMINELYASIKTPHNVKLDAAVASTKAAVEASKNTDDYTAFVEAVSAVNSSADEYAKVKTALDEAEAIYATLIGLPATEDALYQVIMNGDGETPGAIYAYQNGLIESVPQIGTTTQALAYIEQGIRRIAIKQQGEGADVSRGFDNLSCTAGVAPWTISAGNTGYGPVFNTWSTENDPSGMKTPFLQCWRGGGDNAGLEDVTVAYTCGAQTLGGQSVTLYPNSVYEVSGSIRALMEYGTFGTDHVTGLSIYAGDFEQVLDEADEATEGDYNGHPDLYGTFKVKGATDANGNLTFGIKANGTTTNWFAFKNFKITYVSDDPTDLYEDLYKKALATAQETIAAEEYANVAGAEEATLQAAIDNDPNVPETTNYKDGYDQLVAATEAFTAAKAEWDDLAAAIEEATTANATYNDAALATEISTAQTIQGAESATKSDASEEAAKLRAAIETAKQLYIAKEKYYNLYTYIQSSCVDTEDDVYTDVDGALATLQTAMTDTKAVVDPATTIEAVNAEYEKLRAAGVTFVNAVDIHMDKYFDVTWVMTNPDFNTTGEDLRWYNRTDCADIDGWIFSNSGSNYVRNAWNNCEAYECDFDIHQTITGMPVGFYELHVSAFQRRGSSAAVYEAYTNNYEGDYANRKVSSVIYLNEEETTIKSICDEHSETQIYTGSSTFGQEGDSQPATGFFIPNGMDGANAWFAHGYYDNKVYVEVPDGNLTVGFKSGEDGYQSGDWTIFDNFRLFFYGSSLTIEMSENENTNLLAMDNQHVKLTRTITASTSSQKNYNTLTLPFDVTAEKLADAFGSDVQVYAYDGDENNSVKFSKATTITANTPVLLTTSTASTEDPYIFQNVDIKATAGGAVAKGTDIDFVGTYAASTSLVGKYFISGNNIYEGTDATKPMKGTRAYFTANSGAVNALSLNIDGETITAIQGIDGTITPKAIYNLQGQKVNNPVKGGIYIIDGKKTLVK